MEITRVSRFRIYQHVVQQLTNRLRDYFLKRMNLEFRNDVIGSKESCCSVAKQELTEVLGADKTDEVWSTIDLMKEDVRKWQDALAPSEEDEDMKSKDEVVLEALTGDDG